MVYQQRFLVLLLLQFSSLFEESQCQDQGGNSSIFLRLVDPNSATTDNETLEGRLEIYYHGVWRTVCADNFSPIAAPVVCASLDFGRTGRLIRNTYGQDNGNILLDSVTCKGDELSIADCSHAIWGAENPCYYGFVAISCSNSSIFLRLFNPNSTTRKNDTKEGRLEIYYNGVWGTVCAYRFSEDAARVVCDSLGFGRIGRFIRNSYGQGNRTILFDYIFCRGYDRRIADCYQFRFDTSTNCNNDDVAISCSNSSIFLRLSDPYSATRDNDTMEGRLEIYYYGVWGAVCNYQFSDASARVVCVSLGFGPLGRIIRNIYGQGNGNILFDSVSCTGLELSIADCTHSRWGSENYCYYGDVAISCSNSSIFTRLFNPYSTTSTNNDTKEGRLEIYYNGVWGTVCDNSFSDAAARVVCDSLGFWRIGRFIRNSYGPGNRNILFDYVSCNGYERIITDCGQIRLGPNTNCNNEDVAISCSNSSISIRLFNPNSTSANNDTMEGRLEINYNGVWGTICANGVSAPTARVVCASLGFGRTGRIIRNSYGQGNGNILFDSVSCNGNELSITDCSHSRWGSENYCYCGDVAISCSNSSIFIRLYNPNSTTTNNDTKEGRLEIGYNGVWGTVCADSFSDAGAQVVCSSLGFGRIGRFIRNSYGSGNFNNLFVSVSCNGNEQSINDCSQTTWNLNTYYCSNAVAVNCSNSSIFVRLFNPNSTTTNNDTVAGRLEIYYNGAWGTVCDNIFSDVAARVVCASLGFLGRGRYIRNYYGPGNGNVLLDSVICSGTELSIADCSHSKWGSEIDFSYYGDVAISCTNSSIFIRLFNPNSTTMNNDTRDGRLEIYYNGVWGTVCSDGFSEVVARVVCYSLGFGRMGRFIHNSYGPGNRNVLFRSVACSGFEQSITDCYQDKSNLNVYCYNTDVAVSCGNSSIFLRLVNPNSASTDNEEGRLEIYYNGAWGTVCVDSISEATARVVCASLGFGRTGRIIRNSYGQGNGNVLFDSLYCNGDELSIADCSHSKWGSEIACYNGDVAISCKSGTDATNFPVSKTTALLTTTKPTTPLATTSKRSTSVVTTLKPTTPLATTSKRSTSVATTPQFLVTSDNAITTTTNSINHLVSTLQSTTRDAVMTSKPVAPITTLVTTPTIELTTGVITDSKPTIPITNTPKVTTLESVTALIDTSKVFNGEVSTFGPAYPKTTVTASKIASTTYDASSVATSLKSTTTDRSACNSSPCVHAATCVDLAINDYECSCASGFTGRNCETDIAECDSDPCQHDSKCIDGLNSYQCQCLNGYTGTNCETKLVTCQTLACVNGTCFTDNNNPSCACVKGYRGLLCDENIAECDSDPCQHDSKCSDGLNSYQCQCLDGYTGTNCETELNECESNPCPINSTCEGSINRYQCLCPNPDQFIGIHCNIAVPPPKQSDSPEFVEISPTHGPVSGGTRITIKGRNLDKYGGISFVYIGTMKLPIKTWTSTWSEFSIVTPAGESSMVFQDQKLIFEITGGKNISSDLIFTYQPDPEIEDVKPTEHLASGGTTLTIMGNNLNSSASPFLRVILNTTKPGYRNKNITIINGPKCDANSANEIYCLMPPVNVEGDTVVNQPAKGRRRRREDNAQNITTILTLKLISDGAEDVPNKTIEYIDYKGALDPVKGPKYFNPEDDPFIHIKGRDFDIGITRDDGYEILVGADECTNITLTTNDLSCRPPTEEPELGSDQANYCSESGGLPVIVFAGRKVDDHGVRIKLIWGACLIYPGFKFSWWIVGVICGGSGLLIIVTIVCFIVCKRCRRPKRALSARHPSGYNAKTDWAKLEVNAQGKLKSKQPRKMRDDTYASRFTNDSKLNSYDNAVEMGDVRPNDYNRTLASDWTRNNIVFDERGRQLTQYELDMMAAERNAHDLRNPVSVRYSYGLLSGDDARYAARHGNSDYINNNYEPRREIFAVPDWRNHRRRPRPPTKHGQFGGDWRPTDGSGIIVAPALRANRHDFLGQNGGFHSPLYGSRELPTTGDMIGQRFGHRGQ